jgi:dTDP-4-amino-4,6-dideoxygalactose transaminase
MVNVYQSAFKGHKHVQPLKTLSGYETSWHIYPIQLQLDTLSITRDEFIVQLTERNIGTSVHYIPLHEHSFYSKKYGWKPETFPNAHRAGQRMISLPLSSALTARDAEDVVAAVDEICKKFKK